MKTCNMHFFCSRGCSPAGGGGVALYHLMDFERWTNAPLVNTGRISKRQAGEGKGREGRWSCAFWEHGD